MLRYSSPLRSIGATQSLRYQRARSMQGCFRTNTTAAGPVANSVSESPESIQEETIKGFLDANGDGILFFDNVYPLKTALYDPRFLFHRFTPRSHSPKHLVSRAVPPDLPIIPKTMTPRPKDGGAFLRFEYDNTKISLDEIQKRTRQYLKTQKERPWFNPIKIMDAFIVRGRPWIEDLHRYPSKRLKVEFEGPDLTQETLYSMFRQFGRIRDIIPASPSSKELPRYAVITFLYARSATAAKNCLHQVVEDGTKLHISYISIHTALWFIWDWIINHPRITIPAAAAILAVIMGSIFDPIRTWAVENKITRKWHMESSRIVQWLQKSFKMMVPFQRRNQGGKEQVWKVDENVNRIKDWIGENQESFIVVVGPKGTAKRELVVDGVLEGRPNLLILDCEAIVEQHSDSAIIRNLAQQVGYTPIFNWLNFLSSLLDLAAQGTIGQKAGFTETLDTQVKKILNTTATALKKAALRKKPKPEKGQHEIRDEEFLEQNPQARPVVLIDNFLHKADHATVVHDNIAQWATVLMEANVAHVIFLTNDIGYSKVLTTDRVLRTITLSDKDPEAAKLYVFRQLEYIENERRKSEAHTSDTAIKTTVKQRDLNLDNSIRVLGGRMRDLEGLAQRLAMGISPDGLSHLKLLTIDALKDIVAQSASEILKLYFLGGSSAIKWTPEQAWTLVKCLASQSRVSYNATLLDPLFAQDETALHELAQAELITISSTPEGRPAIIKPGRPVFSAAFALLAEDRVFNAKMELARLTFLSGDEKKNIEKAEEELARLKELPPMQVREIESRIRYLLKKIRTSQQNIETFDIQIGIVKDILKTEI